jgi:hypothetical protein
VLTRAHYRYLVLEQCIGGALFNFAFNAAIAWPFFHGFADVPLWGVTSIASDTLSTCFLLPFMTCVVVTRLARREIRRGRFDVPGWRRSAHPILGRLPRNTEMRGLLLGALCLALVAPVALGVFVSLQIQTLPFREFLVFKSTFAGVLGGIFTPVVALASLGDAVAVPAAKG